MTIFAKAEMVPADCANLCGNLQDSDEDSKPLWRIAREPLSQEKTKEVEARLAKIELEEEFYCPWRGWFEQLPRERHLLTKTILPFLEGPLDDDFLAGIDMTRVVPLYEDCNFAHVFFIRVTHARLSEGWYQLGDGAFDDPLIGDCIGLLGILDKFEAALRDSEQRENLGYMLRLALELGYEMGKVEERLIVGPLADMGWRATAERPRAMQVARSRAAAAQRSDNQQRAIKALERARQNFPTAAADDKISFLKIKAAERLKISRRQFDRWLKG